MRNLTNRKYILINKINFEFKNVNGTVLLHQFSYLHGQMEWRSVKAESLLFKPTWRPDKIDLPPKFNTLKYHS